MAHAHTAPPRHTQHTHTLMRPLCPSLPQLPGHPAEPVVSHLRHRRHPDLYPVAAHRPQPQQPGQRGGGQAVPGEPQRVRPQSDGGGGGQLGRGGAGTGQGVEGQEEITSQPHTTATAQHGRPHQARHASAPAQHLTTSDAASSVFLCRSPTRHRLSWLHLLARVERGCPTLVRPPHVLLAPPLLPLLPVHLLLFALDSPPPPRLLP